MKPLGEIAKVFFGIKTGYNDYFILDEEKVREWGIEKEFLVPCVSSPKKVKGLIIRPEDVKEYFFMVGEDQEVPEDSNAYKYIKYGEKLEVEVTRGSQRGKRKLPELETVKGRKRWYSLPSFPPPPILFQYLSDEWPRAFLNLAGVHAPNIMHYVYPTLRGTEDLYIILGYANSSVAALLTELYGRSYGGGVLKVEVYELKQIPVLDPAKLQNSELEKLRESFENLASAVDNRIEAEQAFESVKSKSAKDRGILEYEFEEKLEEARKDEKNAQKELDEAIYDILGLSQEERRQVEDGLKELQEIRRKRTHS
jgi:adenine-specific DNA-methyltransferase